MKLKWTSLGVQVTIAVQNMLRNACLLHFWIIELLLTCKYSMYLLLFTVRLVTNKQTK